MTANLLLDNEVPAPRCYNRPPAADGRWLRNGYCPRTLKVRLRWSPRWFEDRCATWLGTGIGQPTPEYPSGTPYPIAHGWVSWCRSCRWRPAGVRL